MTKYTSTKVHAPADESVQIPAAIRAAAARSQALHDSVYQTDAGNEGGKPEDKPVDKAGEGQENKPKETSQDEPNGRTERQSEKANGEGQEQPQSGQEDNAPPAQAGADDADWKHKYNSLKPRFDQQRETINGLNSRISHMERLLAQKATPPPQERTPENTFKALSSEDRETYGEDFLDVAARAAQEKLHPEIAALKRQIEELGGKVGGVTQQTKAQMTQQLYGTLDRDVPNWREINRSQDFLAWANLPDPFSGDIRITLLRDAFDKGDAPRVARFFKGFLSDEAVTDPAGQRPEMLNPASNGGNPSKVPLERFAAPGRAKAPAATQVPGEKETITRAQIHEFYRQVNQGRYRGNEAEKDRLEKMIFEAEKEGRIV